MPGRKENYCLQSGQSVRSPLRFNSSLMKTFSTMAVVSLLAITTQAQTKEQIDSKAPQATAQRVTGRGSNHRNWQWETYEKTPDGTIRPHIHKYTELATGLHYKDAKGQWVESKEVVESFAGGAIARQGQHQVIFANNLNSYGAIDVQTPDGKRLRSNILGLMYHDTATDDAVLIAQIQDSTGELIADNQVLYPNAFKGIKADVRYTYKIGSFEQDVILREQPPSPESFGMNPATTELEVATEFLNPPAEAITQSKVADVGQDISWGASRIGRGKAFELDQQKDPSKIIPVKKVYMTVGDRNVLLEKVRIPQAKASLSKLPKQASVNIEKPMMASLDKVLPKTPLAMANRAPIKLASTTPSNQGFVLDYVLIDTDQDDFVFQGDTTYYFSHGLYFSGNDVIEGGAVMKYNTDPESYVNIEFWGTVTLKTAPYHPAIFTSDNDDTVGEPISDDGKPLAYYWSAIAGPSSSDIVWHDIVVKYAHTGVHLAGGQLSNCQFVDCQYPFWFEFAPASMTNMLVVNADSAFIGEYTDIKAYQVTVFGCTNLTLDWWGGTGNTLELTNCLLVNVQSNGDFATITTNCTPRLTDTGGQIFQTVVGGSAYLQTNSPYRNAGTTNVDACVLADIATKTTYPPITYSNTTISAITNFSTQVQRDADLPDLGYHYCPLDYVFANVEADTNISFAAGTAVGWFRTTSGWFEAGDGIHLLDKVSATFNGTASKPCYWVRCNVVQEQDLSGGYGPAGLTSWGDGPEDYLATINVNFTRCTTMANVDGFFRDDGCCGGGHLVVNANNCEFYSTGFGVYYVNLYVTNCFFYRASCGVNNDHDDAGLSLVNCTFIGRVDGAFGVEHWGSSFPVYVANCAFQDATFPDVDTVNVYFDYNAFNTTNQLPSQGTNNVTVTNFNWQSSWLGDFYLPTNSPAINKGSTNANLLRLYHFTTQTNQVKETNSVVDIGYHYVAADGNGNPLDVNGNGTPDYMEDSNGNGLIDTGETNWALAILMQPANQTAVQTSNVTFAVTAAGVAPLQYQWFYNASPLTGSTNSTLTLTNVQTSNAGTYCVVVSNSVTALTSSNATLTVLTLPTISITNPVNNSVFAATPTNISLAAAVTDMAGTVTQVEFFQGTSSLGVVTNAPYSLVWSNASTGNYGLMAIVSDDQGHKATSSVVSIIVSPLFATNSMALWLKADSLTGLTNNAPIGTWQDNSGWTNNATQSSSGSKPFYITNALNNLPIVRFSGGQALNIAVGLSSLMRSASQGEAVVLLKSTITNGSACGLWYVGNNWYSQVYPSTDGSIHETFGTTADPYNLGLPTQPLKQFNVYELSANNTNWSAWLNGQLFFRNTGNTYNFTPGGMVLGYDWSGNFVGDIAEVMFFKRTLTGDERTLVNRYLNSKYGLVPATLAAPTNLTATAISSNQISLRWSETLNGFATQISIERSVSTNGSYSVIAQLTSALSYVDTNLATGTTYYYRVRAINTTSWSDYSESAHATTLLSNTSLPLDSLIVWLKADTGLMQGNTNIPVNYWMDQSGSGNDAIQSSSNNQPFWVPNAVNGLPAIRFDGTNDQLKLARYPATNNFTVFVVARTSLGARVDTENNSTSTSIGQTGEHYLFGGDYDLGYAGAEISLSLGTNVASVYQYMHNNMYGDQASPMTVYGGNIGAGLSIIGVRCTNQQSSIYFNGSLVRTGQPSLRSQSIMARSIGYGSSLGPAFGGDLTEMLVFNRSLSEEECTAVTFYLNSKYLAIPTIEFISPTNSQAFVTPANIPMSVSVVDNVGISQVQYFNGSISLGVVTNAPYTLLWSNVLTGVYQMTAVATDMSGHQASNTISVAVGSVPNVILTKPVSNTVFLSGSNVEMKATAWDMDNPISTVKFFQGTNQIGCATSTPYSIILSNAQAGGYQLTAVAINALGFATTSSVVQVTVDAPPSVGLTSPTNSGLYLSYSNISLTASASDVDGSVLQVQFYRGATSLGVVSNMPYSSFWTNAMPGTYSITARATDNCGIITTSSVANIIVAGITITSPTNDAVLLAPADIQLAAAVSDNTSISGLQYFTNGVSAGFAYSQPYALAQTGLSSGVYVISAVATDVNGRQLTSNPVIISVDTDPNTSDRDMDGVADALEFLIGRNPLSALTSPDSNKIVNLVTFTPLQ